MNNAAYETLKIAQGNYKSLTDAQLRELIAAYPTSTPSRIHRNAQIEYETRAAGKREADARREAADAEQKLLESIQPRMDIVRSATRSSLVRGEMERLLLGRTNIVRGVFAQNRAKAIDHTADVEHCLTLLGMDYTIGNDAPRGGQCGWFAQV